MRLQKELQNGPWYRDGRDPGVHCDGGYCVDPDGEAQGREYFGRRDYSIGDCGDRGRISQRSWRRRLWRL